MRDRIQPQVENKSWSIMVIDVLHATARIIISDFSHANHIPTHSRPYITADSPAGVTISGPPDVLEKLKQASPLLGKRIIALPIYVTSHAPHLFTTEDVTSIMETTTAKTWASYVSKVPIVSCSTGRLVSAGAFNTVLRNAAEQCLREPLSWGKINAEFPTILFENSNLGRIKVLPVGTKATMQAQLREYVSSKYMSESQRPSIEVVSIDATKEKDGLEYVPYSKSKIAVCGLAGRFPGAESPEAFWELLSKGVDTVSEVPANRWDVKTHVDTSGKSKNTSAVPWGCWLNDPELFDARFFGISPKEAPYLDPAQRLALMVTYEAMETAGIVPDATPSTQKERIGVYLGMSSNDYGETNSTQLIGTHSIVGGIRPFVSGRMNYSHKFAGPSYVVDTACSSSLAAMQLAVNALRMGDVDTAVAGGTNVITNPDGHAGLDRGFFLSKTGNCKTFDDGADGYCRGEGIGLVLLKRLDDAIQDGDPIQAVIVDVKTNHSAESDSITRPHAPTQIKLFEKVFSTSGVDPNDISYIEMHGTGTQHGDAAEMTSVLATFAPDTQRRARGQPLYLGAAKANIGHGEAVSGITSVAKVLLMMRNNSIPPHCGIKTTINHTFPSDMKDRNVHIAFKPTSWPRGVAPRKVLLNNFSAPGGNTAMILEDAPAQQVASAQDDRTSHIIAFSAKSGESLLGNMRALLQSLDDKVDESPPLVSNLSYTTTARRQHHNHRASVVASSLEDVRIGLRSAIQEKQGFTRAISSPKIVFAFTGQGSQYMAMGSDLMKLSHFRESFRRLNQLAVVLGYPEFEKVITGSTNVIESYPPVVVQLAVTCLEIALAQLWLSWGIKPDAVVGHSLGEYAALNAAGVLSDADTIYLVGERAKLLQSSCTANTHGMLAVKTSAAEIQTSVVGRKFEIACINGPNDIVLGGPVDQIDSLRSALTSMGVKATPVSVPFAFHTSQVEPLLSEFATAARSITFNKPRIPVLSPLLGRTVTDDKIFGPDYLVRHCRETVNMHDTLRSAYTDGRIVNEKSIFLEIGPHPVVSSMIKASLGSSLTTIPSIQRGKDTWPLLAEALAYLYRAGVDINWVDWHQDFKAALQVIPLPTYSWDLKSYWIQYVGDWSLRKGESATIEVSDSVGPKVPEPSSVLRRPEPKIESTTVHKILREESDEKKAYVLVESDLSRSDLLPIVQGHFVNNIPLCTPSVYAEIALTVGKYLIDKYMPFSQDRLVDVANMEVERALIAKGKGAQMLRASAKVDWLTKTASFSFFSVNAQGQSIIEHATCKTVFRNASDLLPALIATRNQQVKLFDKVTQDVQSGKAFKLNMDVSFKMVAGLAKFHKEYRSSGDIALNGTTLEAASNATFNSVKKGGDFVCHPAIIDGFTQICDFTMNAKATTDLEHEVYVNRGWDSLRIFKDVSHTANYQLYAKMIRQEGTMYKGDVVVLDEEGITASFKGVALRGIPRKAFDMVLQAANEGRELSGSSGVNAARAVVSLKPQSTQHSGVVTAHVVAQPATATVAVHLPAATVITRQTPKRATSKYPSALAIILEETGIAENELSDDSAFADMGVDSLLSMVINSRFKEELGLDIEDESNSVFMTYPTIKHFKDLLNVYREQPEVEDAISVVEVAPAHVPLPIPATIETSGPTQSSVPQQSTSQLNVVRSDAPKRIDLPPPSSFKSILDIIAEETGVDIADLTDECPLADVGIDSLLSMVIASRIREELSLEMEAEDGFFVAYPTIKHIRQFCISASPNSSQGLLTPETERLYASSNNSGNDVVSLPEECVTPTDSSLESEVMPTNVPKAMNNIKSTRSFTSCRPATSVILQGFPKTAKKTLFLLPDGGGSSSSYVPLPRLDGDTAIVGLNCPYARDPENMNCHISDLMKAYISEIQRRQPKGPYHIGGWSSGGVMAYIAIQLLLEAGEEVGTLLILDSPMPATMDKLPPHFYNYCKAIGLFGDVQPPPYLVPHFDATVDVLDTYAVSPISTAVKPKKPLKLAIIWASQSVADGAGKPSFPTHLPHNSVGLAFMVARRTDFGPAGWETLLPADTQIVTGKIDANHFSMMQKPSISQVGRFIDRVMG
ncbi:hypothetical protein TruAng_006244 [Truncatella angustata]|nr:hypothetical protein TruAng_006244 [Truncatella angustata]